MTASYRPPTAPRYWELQAEQDAACVSRAALVASVPEALVWRWLADAGELPSQQVRHRAPPRLPARDGRHERRRDHAD